MFKLSKFFLYLVPFAIAIVTSSTFFPFIVGKATWFRGMVDLALVFFFLGLMFDPRASHIISRAKRIFRHPLTIAIGVFTVAFLLAGFFGVDPWTSFWSNFERGEGGLQILHLAVFFFLLSVLLERESDWRIFLWIMLLSSVLMILYGLGAGLKYVDAEFITTPDGTNRLSGEGGVLYKTLKHFIGPAFNEPGGFRFQGSIGNPAYVAAHLLFSIIFAGILGISKFNSLARKGRLGAGNLRAYLGRYFSRLETWLIILLIIVFAVFFFLTSTRGAFIGAIAGALAFLAYIGFSNKRWRKWVATLAVLGVLAVSVMVIFRNTPAVQAIPGSRVFQLSFQEETLRHRAIMWGIAFEAWKDRPIFGYGPENYLYVFDRYYDPAYFEPGKPFGAWFDRAHSIIFDYLVETGIVGLVAYLGIFVTFFWTLLRQGRLSPEEKNTSLSPDDPNIDDGRSMSSGDPNIKSGVRSSMFVVYALLASFPIIYLVQGLALFDVLPIYLNLFVFFALSIFFLQNDNANTAKKE